jgi:CHAD domain-containing protein
VRIEAKKLRYATEFFAPLFEGRKASKRKNAFLSALENLQDHLGELNDLAVSQKMHPDWFRSEDDDSGSGTHAAHLVAKHQVRRAKRALEPALEAYQEFADAKRFWM